MILCKWFSEHLPCTSWHTLGMVLMFLLYNAQRPQLDESAHRPKVFGTAEQVLISVFWRHYRGTEKIILWWEEFGSCTGNPTSCPSSWIRSFKTSYPRIFFLLLRAEELSEPFFFPKLLFSSRIFFVTAPPLDLLPVAEISWHSDVLVPVCFFHTKTPGTRPGRPLQSLLVCAPAQLWKCHSVRETNLFPGGSFCVFTCVSFSPSWPPVLWGCSFVVSQACWEHRKPERPSLSGRTWCWLFLKSMTRVATQVWEGGGGFLGLTVSGRNYWKTLESTTSIRKSWHFLKKENNLYTVGLGGAFLWSLHSGIWGRRISR